MGGDAGFIFQPCVRRHFPATLFARPMFCCQDQLPAQLLAAQVFIHVPGFDVTDRRGLASFAVVAQSCFDKRDQIPVPA